MRDVAVVGGGPAGAITAMLLARAGYDAAALAALREDGMFAPAPRREAPSEAG